MTNPPNTIIFDRSSWPDTRYDHIGPIQLEPSNVMEPISITFPALQISLYTHYFARNEKCDIQAGPTNYRPLTNELVSFTTGLCKSVLRFQISRPIKTCWRLSAKFQYVPLCKQLCSAIFAPKAHFVVEETHYTLWRIALVYSCPRKRRRGNGKLDEVQLAWLVQFRIKRIASIRANNECTWSDLRP